MKLLFCCDAQYLEFEATGRLHLRVPYRFYRGMCVYCGALFQVCNAGDSAAEGYIPMVDDDFVGPHAVACGSDTLGLPNASSAPAAAQPGAAVPHSDAPTPNPQPPAPGDGVAT